MTTPAFTIHIATPKDAGAIVNVQTKTWLATYPNVELGITEADIRRRILGKNDEHLKQRIHDWREGSNGTALPK